MPRHLHAALDQLMELDPDDVCTDWTLANARPLLEPYAKLWCYWHDEGFEIDIDARLRIRRLWSDAEHLRWLLQRLIAWYPCDEFESISHDLVEAHAEIGYSAWLNWAPRLEGIWRSVLAHDARKFNDAWTAMTAGMLWARYFSGGDEAYRAVALAFRRADRKYMKVPHEASDEHFLRHCLEQHGEVSEREMTAINRHLDPLDDNVLQFKCPSFMTRREPDPVAGAKHLAAHFDDRRQVARAFAGDAWSSADDQIYDAARLRVYAAIA